MLFQIKSALLTISAIPDADTYVGQKEITDDLVIGEVSLAYEVFRVDVNLDF